MKNVSRGPIIAGMVLAFLAGCSSLLFDSAQGKLAQDYTPPIGVSGAIAQESAAARQPASGDLLYAVTTGNKYVYVMTYPTISLLHRLGPFPQGGAPSLCVNSANGDVYVLDPGPSYTGGKIYIYKHGSTSSIRTLPLLHDGRKCCLSIAPRPTLLP